MSSYFKAIKNHVLNWRDFFLDLIFPIECLGCGQEKIWLCEKCFHSIEFNIKSRCPACNRPTHCGQYCIFCEDDYSLNGIFVAGNYENEIIKALIKNFKYHLIIDLGVFLGSFCSQYFGDQIEQEKLRAKSNSDFSKIIIKYDGPKNLFNSMEEILIIPVPLHPRRLRWRGFNQSELIAEHFAKNLNLEINKNNLIRTRYKTAQVKLNKKARVENIKNCFAWQGEKISKKIILIDDITTTGSTLDECAKVLKENGAVEVWGLVVAKN